MNGILCSELLFVNVPSHHCSNFAQSENSKRQGNTNVSHVYPRKWVVPRSLIRIKSPPLGNQVGGRGTNGYHP